MDLRVVPLDFVRAEMNRLLLCSFLALLPMAAGCLHRPDTNSEARAASFARFSEQNVGTVRLEDFLRQRTTILIGGLPADSAGEIERGSSATGHAGAHARYATGMATAIDPRGYLLTAGHCVDWQPLHALMADRDRIRLVPVRVIWRGTPSRNEPDLALLHVNEALSAHFEWADGVPMNAAVVGAGPDARETASFAVECFAGIVLGSTKSDAAGTAHANIEHSAPIREGDSGGPLATVEGRLMGVNVGDVRELHILTFDQKRTGRAQRPDLAWLNVTIERDFSSRTPAANSPL